MNQNAGKGMEKADQKIGKIRRLRNWLMFFQFHLPALHARMQFRARRSIDLLMWLFYELFYEPHELICYRWVEPVKLINYTIVA